jgi:putative membrane protein
MKRIVRIFVFHLIALWLTTQILVGFTISNNLAAFITSAFVLSLLMLIVKPILTILFIPINLITFGLLSWVINVVILYLLTLFVPAVVIVPWTFPGASWAGFAIPSFYLSYLLSLITSALVVTFISNTLEDLV